MGPLPSTLGFSKSKGTIHNFELNMLKTLVFKFLFLGELKTLVFSIFISGELWEDVPLFGLRGDP